MITTEDVSISYLPLAHMFERMIQVVALLHVYLFSFYPESAFFRTNTLKNVFLSQLTMYYFGARVGFFQGDISLLMDDIKTLKPTLFPVVPRILNRIYDKVSEALKYFDLQTLRRLLVFLKQGLYLLLINFFKDPGFGDLTVSASSA